MKKFISLLIIALVVSISAIKAQQVDTLYYRATQVNFKFEQKWLGWQECDIYVEMIPEIHKITIYTLNMQYIDYGTVNKQAFKDYDLLYANGTDTNYQDVKVAWYLYHSGTAILKLIYPTIELKYMLSEVINY